MFERLFEMKEKQRNVIIFIASFLLVAYTSLWAFGETIQELFINKILLNGDGAFTGLFLQTVKESTVIDLVTQNLTNSNFGWPYDLNFSYFPFGNLLEILVIKFLLIISPLWEPSNIIHIISILKALLIFTTAYWASRKLQLKVLFSVVVGFLFCFSNYNLIRAEGHFFLGLTWTVPLGMVCLIKGLSLLLGGLDKDKRFNNYHFISCGLLVGLSTLYYSVFFLFISVSILVFILIVKFLSHKNSISFNLIVVNFKNIFKSPLMLFTLSNILGLTFQLLPVFIRRYFTFSLTNGPQRSYIEPFLYGGSIESLFYDFNKLITRVFLDRPDIQQFLASRVTWEATQVGALFGVIIFLSIGFSLLKSINSNDKFEIDTNFASRKSILIVSAFTLIFYFPSFIHLVIYQFFPEIRAYGRLSIFITFLTILYSVLLISNFKLKSKISILLLILIILPGVAEIYGFKQARPSAAALQPQYDQFSKDKVEFYSKLDQIFEQECKLIIAPLSPFPEFDNPNDSNNDFAGFDYMAQEKSNFIWGNGSMKNTLANKYYEILYSQYPNFIRTDLNFLINYLKNMGFCGVIFDLTQMIPSELKDFRDILASNDQECVIELNRERFTNLSRFYAMSFLNKSCFVIDESISRKIYMQVKNNNFIWLNKSQFGEYYLNGIQMFKADKQINLDFKFQESLNNLRMYVQHEPNTVPSDATICYQIDNVSEKCSQVSRTPQGDTYIDLEHTFNSKVVYSLSFRMLTKTSTFSSWGLFPAQI